jgi:hypothetical protein
VPVPISPVLSRGVGKGGQARAEYVPSQSPFPDRIKQPWSQRRSGWTDLDFRRTIRGGLAFEPLPAKECAVQFRIRPRLAFVLAPTIALVIGGVFIASRPRPLIAGGVGRSGESISATGTFAIHQTPDKRQIPLDAIYWLDYRSAKLYATTPEVSKSTGAGKMISDLAIRDLVVDFKLAPGVAPHFLMNTASLGALGGGTSALFVIETTTKQLAVYWSYPKTTGLNSKPEFELVQVRSYATPAPPGDDSAATETISASGAITLQLSMDKTQVPLDAVYWLESSPRGTTLYTAIPEIRKTAKNTQMVGDVASRDLGPDFKLSPGMTPHFLVNTASLGANGMGMSALFIMETTTKQLGIYRAYPRATVQGAKPAIDLLQVKPYDESLPVLPRAN